MPSLPVKMRRVLVIDDDEDSAELTQTFVEMRGHESRVAYDAHGALAAAAEFLPDVALVDIHLGGDSGFILAQQLLAVPGLERCRLVAISGLPEDAVKVGAGTAGVTFYRHVMKPFEADRFFDAIESEDGAA